MPSLRALIALAAVLITAFVAPPARAQGIVTENVSAELVSARSAVTPGETFTVALRLRVREGWHTYWRNPGDSGAPTTLLWSAPAGWTVSEILWPAPKPVPFGPLMNYGFEGETLYPIKVSVPADAGLGQTTLPVKAEWLVCSDVCIPEGGDMALPVKVAAAGVDDPDWAKPIAAALAALPARQDGVEARVTAAGDLVRLTIAGGPLAGGGVAAATFFPYDGALIDHAAPQNAEAGPNGVAVTLTPGPAGAFGDRPVAGVLVYAAAGGEGALEIEAAPGPALAGAGGAALAPRAQTASTAAGGLGLPLALVFAFLGGLILNVMPCVFPVLSLKALALARGAHGGEAKRHGLVFAAGVMTTFLALGALVAALASAGAGAAWGFQLQNPVVVSLLALLFFAIGLNLLGAFELSLGGLQNAGGGLAARGGDVGAFFTGALAVVAATPCTAPFMAGALGFAATQPPPVALAVFAALGAGFAAPMLALSFTPALLDRIPRPGPWMETAKQILAFPMFAAAVWLAWILAAIAGPEGLLILLAVALALAFSIWALRAFRALPARAAAAAAALGLAAAVAWVAQPQSVALVAEPWSAARLAELRAEGRPVFVNFTADWCVTCKVNERTSLASAEVARAFADGGVAYLKADWTARDDVIAAELANHGRTGVPLYLFYPGEGGPPVVLAQILTPDAVIETVSASGPLPTASAETGRSS